MKPTAGLLAAALLLAAGAIHAQEAAPEAPAAEPVAEPAPAPVEAPAKAAPAPAKAAPAAAPPAGARTTVTPAAPARPARSGAAAVPLNQRVAVIAVLDKRLGTTANFTLKPGEGFRFGHISGLLRSCETTQPFERKQSAAFVQVADQPRVAGGGKAPAPKLVFSGWMFAESPSLNPFVHPVYDVWLKSCTMHFPDGPKPPSSSTGKRTSGARKSAEPKSGEAPPAAVPAPAPAATPEG